MRVHDKLDILKGTRMALQQDQKPDGEFWAIKSLWKKTEIVKSPICTLDRCPLGVDAETEIFVADILV